MNKKIIAASLLGAGFIGAAVFTPIAVFAATNPTTTVASTFVTKLAAKLGLDQSQVQTAVDAVRADIQAENQATYKTNVQQAVTDGKLTQRQADLLLAAQTVRDEQMAANQGTNSPQVDDTLTPQQRKTQMETERTQREQAVVDALNAKGLNTSLTELQAAQTAERSAGIRPEMGPGRHMGMF